MPNKNIKQRALKILNILKLEYPEVKPALDYQTPFQLVISTILSAQCTDARVNIVTKELFKKYKTPRDYLNASNEELEKDIFSTGFYRNKAKNIKACCEKLLNDFKGKVPNDFDSLTKLPGVGRKTASVVAGNAFGIPAIAVDTHVIRLSNLLGFINSKDAVKIEFRLKEIFPKEDWINISHWLAVHGRNICIARRPKCEECKLALLCPWYQNKLSINKI
jgi:endonuclease-3